jgi:hypothetical protein
MPTAYLLPVSDGTFKQIHHTKPAAPTSHWDKVDDLPPGHDGNTTAVYTKFIGPGDPPEPKLE